VVVVVVAVAPDVAVVVAMAVAMAAEATEVVAAAATAPAKKIAALEHATGKTAATAVVIAARMLLMPVGPDVAAAVARVRWADGVWASGCFKALNPLVQSPFSSS
jgi:hypothetical protein